MIKDAEITVKRQSLTVDFLLVLSVKHLYIYIKGVEVMKRYIAPVLSALAVGIVIAAFGIFYFLIFKEIPGARVIRFIFASGVLIGVGALTAVLIQRIREIKRGEEDDLGKY